MSVLNWISGVMLIIIVLLFGALLAAGTTAGVLICFHHILGLINDIKKDIMCLKR